MNSTRVVAIIQVRMGSTRLPGKSLVEISGKPLIEHVVDRIKAARTVDEIGIATTHEDGDRVLMDWGIRHGLLSYAGEVNDVLDRYYHAAVRFGADVIVRVTADDPFKDPDVTDRIVRTMLDDPLLDYASNTIKPTYPEGLDIEVFRFAALERSWRKARLPSEREHVTPYIWNHPDQFAVKNVEHTEDLSAWRWTLDYNCDLEFTREVYARLYRGQVFGMNDIVNLLRAYPEIAAINSDVVRNEGYLKSLRKDEEFRGKRTP